MQPSLTWVVRDACVLYIELYCVTYSEVQYYVASKCLLCCRVKPPAVCLRCVGKKKIYFPCSRPIFEPHTAHEWCLLCYSSVYMLLQDDDEADSGTFFLPASTRCVCVCVLVKITLRYLTSESATVSTIVPIYRNIFIISPRTCVCRSPTYRLSLGKTGRGGNRRGIILGLV